MLPLVSTVIPTFDRRKDVVVAVRTALAQTHPHQEIIVVDDGSRDGTAARLREVYGDRLRIVRTDRLGVSGARNRGMHEARGAYIALLDSDDEWEPEKLERQVAFLEARPDYGMVLTDVVQMGRDRVAYDVFRRRAQLPEDGNVLPYVLRQPALAPSSALFRRRVFEEVGGFDASLPTAEDLDFHLRVALRLPIGVVAEPLTRAMRGHDGLSALKRTYTDYMYVMERFLLDHRHEIAAAHRSAALREAALRNMRGLLFVGELGPAMTLGVRVAARARSARELATVARMAPAVVLCAARKVKRAALEA